MSVYLRISSQHYQIISPDFENLIYITVQTSIYVDYFPSFYFDANQPMMIWLGDPGSKASLYLLT